MVLRFDREQKRISLGLKQILPDPWDKLRDEYRVGQTVNGTVSRVVPFGAFVRLESGIEGIIPNSELPGDRGQRAQGVLKDGQSVQAKIVSLRPEERRMTLSLRQAQRAQERRELKEYMTRQEESSRVTIGDLVGDLFAEVRAAEPAEETTEEVAAEEEVVADAAEVEAEAEAEEPAEQPEEEQPEEGEAAAEEEKPTDVEGGASADEGEKAEENEEESGEGAPCSSSESQAESEAEKE
jgi:predicted RNA-binding protein with RPS1 domain